jgi:gluconokinase
MTGTIIVMGVSGCGKTLIGQKLATALGGAFEDADSYHTEAAKDLMRQKIPLTDNDRWPWLQRLRAEILRRREEPGVYVLACSALRESYRRTLAGDDGDGLIRFVFLDGSFDLISHRMGARTGHYMPLELLVSQFATLERPSNALRVDISGGPDEILAAILAAL